MGAIGQQPLSVISDVLGRPGVELVRRLANDGIQGALTAVEPATAPTTQRLAQLSAALDPAIEDARAGVMALRDAAAAERAANPGIDALDGAELLRRTPETMDLLVQHNPILGVLPRTAQGLAEPMHPDAARLVGFQVGRATMPDPKKGRPPSTHPIVVERQVGNVAGYPDHPTARAMAHEVVRERGGTAIIKELRNEKTRSHRYLVLHTSGSFEPVAVSGRIRTKQVDPTFESSIPDRFWVVTQSRPMVEPTAGEPGVLSPLALDELRNAGATETASSGAKQLEAAAGKLEKAATTAAATRGQLGEARRLAAALEAVPSAPGKGGPIDWEGAQSLVTTGYTHRPLLPNATGELTVPAGTDLFSAVTAAKAHPYVPFAVLQDTSGAYHLARAGTSLLQVADAVASGRSKEQLHPDVRALVMHFDDGPSVITPTGYRGQLVFVDRPDGKGAARTWNLDELSRKRLASLAIPYGGAMARPRNHAPYKLPDLTTSSIKVGMQLLPGRSFVVARGAGNAPWLVPINRDGGWSRGVDYTRNNPPEIIGFADDQDWMPVSGPQQHYRFGR